MADAVRVMPLERTKGLEFSRVYVIGLHAGAVPGAAPAGAPKVPEGVGGRRRPPTRTRRGGCSTWR